MCSLLLLCSDAFIIIDLLLASRLAYWSGSTLVTEPRAIAKRYARTLLPLNALSALLAITAAVSHA